MTLSENMPCRNRNGYHIITCPPNIEYNTVRPHSSLDYKPPAPEAIMPLHFDPFWLSSSQENIAQILT